MSWSTELFCNIHFNRKSYNSLYEVEDDIRDIEQRIQKCKEELRTGVFMTEPDKFYNKDEYSSPGAYLRDLYETNIEVLEDSVYELYKLYILKDNWPNCHDKTTGFAIAPPENIHWNTAYLDGDFIKTTDSDFDDECDDENDENKHVSSDSEKSDNAS